MIEAKQIHMSFGDTPILRGISATFERGKTNLIIGQSGAGKTVLLKLLVGLLEPVQGQILYDGRDVTHLTQKEIRTVRMEVGMLFQGSALFDFMTVEENIRFPLDMFTNWTKKEKVDRVNYCLERVNLEGVNDKFPSEVSGGMQKRVGIARAIVLKPKFLFCDEPNSGLDPKTSILIDDLIHSITMENNITTVINTHDMNSVMEIGENIILLNKGEIAWHGSANDVLSSTNDYLQEFIFASPFLQRLRQAALEQESKDKR